MVVHFAHLKFERYRFIKQNNKIWATVNRSISPYSLEKKIAN